LKDGGNTRNSSQQAASSTAGLISLSNKFCHLIKAKQLYFATDTQKKQKIKKKMFNIGSKKKGNTLQHSSYYYYGGVSSEELIQRFLSAFKHLWLTVPLNFCSKETMMTVTSADDENYFSAYWCICHMITIIKIKIRYIYNF